MKLAKLTLLKCPTKQIQESCRKLIVLIWFLNCRSRQYQAAAPGTNDENNENSESTEGSKQAETPEWERARQALAKVNSQIPKSPAKSSTNANNNNSSSAASSIQQQTMAYQQYYQYYQQWGGFAPYSYQYPGYMPAYTMPPQPTNVPPPPVSVCSNTVYCCTCCCN